MQKQSIENLKEFYLDRLAKREPRVAARLNASLQAQRAPAPRVDTAQPQASGQLLQQGSGSGQRPTFHGSAAAGGDIEDLEVMCNNCFNLIKSSDAANCTGDASTCSAAQRFGLAAGSERPKGTIAVLDMKLQKLRVALEERVQDSESKLALMRHLTQLRYHIDTALKWTPGCTEVGVLSDHTVQQVKQLTATSRVLAPAVYVFSRRVENVVSQKDRELRRDHFQAAGSRTSPGDAVGRPNLEVSYAGGLEDSVVGVNSIVSDMDSDCGTRYTETVVTNNDVVPMDVGNVQDANDCIALKSEDEQRRWFYSQCLSLKLACPDKALARKTLISDLYARVRQEGIPIEGWVQSVKQHLMIEDRLAATTPVPMAAAPPAATKGAHPATVGTSTGASMRGGYGRLLNK
jgi:hypothetical protein